MVEQSQHFMLSSLSTEVYPACARPAVRRCATMYSTETGCHCPCLLQAETLQLLKEAKHLVAQSMLEARCSSGRFSPPGRSWNCTGSTLFSVGCVANCYSGASTSHGSVVASAEIRRLTSLEAEFARQQAAAKTAATVAVECMGVE